MPEIITLDTHTREELVEITDQVQAVVTRSGVRDGVCLLHSLHTTAGLCINEHADPTVRGDILLAYRRAFPDDLPYRHGEGNSPAHVKATVAGSSLSVPIKDGRLLLGTWQGIFFCEFDGPRAGRKVAVVVLREG